MVGHEVDDDFQACLVRPLHEQFELTDTPRWVAGNVWIDIIVVSDGIRAAGFALHHIGVVDGKAHVGIIRPRGMCYDACVPYMRTAKASDVFQCLGCEVLHRSAPILLLRAEGYKALSVVTEEPGEDLVEGWGQFAIRQFAIYYIYNVGMAKAE